MSIFFKSYLLVLLLLFHPFLLAKQELRVGVGNFPPFFIENGERGLFLDITKKIFELMPEYDATFTFMSNSKLLREINKGGGIDVACNIFAGSNVDAYLSEPLFRYTDVAVSKKENNFIINNVSDLKKRSISAYQGAIDLLGEDFKQMAYENKSYTEHGQPSETTLLVAMGKKDVRVGDVFIFLYDISKNKYKKRGVNANDFKIHWLWSDVFTHMAFRDESIRDKANKAILEIQNNGVLEQIYKEHEVYLRFEESAE